MTKVTIKRFLSLLTVFLIVAVIYRFSAQSGEDSHEVSRFLARKVYALLIKVNPDITLSMVDFILRKTAHFTLYFILGCAMCGVSDAKNVKTLIIDLILCMVFAASDEFHQVFSFGRTARVADIFLDSCGAGTGIYIAFLLKKRGREAE